MPLPEATLRLGRLFESEFHRQAVNGGALVSRNCDQLGVLGTKAPIAYGQYNGYRLPDFSVMKSGATSWAEVKYKSKPTPTWRACGRLDHGIDLPNWHDYLAVEKVSGQRGFLVLGEGSTGRILIASFQHLRGCSRIHSERSPSFPDGGVFWPADQFAEWGSFSPINGQMRFEFGFLP